MLLSSHQTLEDFLVRILAERRSATTQLLHEEVCKRYQTYSLPAVYKEVRKLQERGVVLKRKNELSLSLAWMLNLIELTDKMYDEHIESSIPTNILPVDTSKTSFRFSNLARVDDFWIHAIILMLQHSKRKTMFQWHPHPWFNLVNSHKSFPFHNALRTAGFRIDNIVGGNTFLDYQAGRINTKNVYEYSFATSPFQDDRSNCYSVTDSFLLTVKLTKKKAADIDHFYDSVTAVSDFNVGAALQLAGNAPGTVVTIERNRNKIKKIWNRFVDYYSVSPGLKL
ncbi:hypothetical protein OAO01_03085 [Oligoflexia bacterium]|nr:hypothetical protein [Oligoflexia bacterium]